MSTHFVFFRCTIINVVFLLLFILFGRLFSNVSFAAGDFVTRDSALISELKRYVGEKHPQQKSFVDFIGLRKEYAETLIKKYIGIKEKVVRDYTDKGFVAEVERLTKDFIELKGVSSDDIIMTLKGLASFTEVSVSGEGRKRPGGNKITLKTKNSGKRRRLECVTTKQPLLTEFQKARRRELIDFEFSRESTKLLVWDRHERAAITEFYRFCERVDYTLFADLVKAFSEEQPDQYFFIACMIDKWKRGCAGSEHGKNMIDNVLSAYVAKKKVGDSKEIDSSVFFKVSADATMARVNKAKENDCCRAVFSSVTLLLMKSKFYSRGLDMDEVLRDGGPKCLPGIYWDMVTRLENSIKKAGKETWGGSLFGLLGESQYNDDCLLDLMIYLSLMVMRTQCGDSSTRYSNEFVIYIDAMCINAGVKTSCLDFDAYENMKAKLAGEKITKPAFSAELNCMNKKELRKRAKSLELKYNSSRPDRFSMSLWVVVMSIFNTMEEKDFPGPVTSLRAVLECCFSETSEFYMAVLAHIFSYPELLERRWRLSVEYWLQSMLIDKGLGSIGWREEIAEYPLPLF